MGNNKIEKINARHRNCNFLSYNSCIRSRVYRRAQELLKCTSSFLLSRRMQRRLTSLTHKYFPKCSYHAYEESGLEFLFLSSPRDDGLELGETFDLPRLGNKKCLDSSLHSCQTNERRCRRSKDFI